MVILEMIVKLKMLMVVIMLQLVIGVFVEEDNLCLPLVMVVLLRHLVMVMNGDGHWHRMRHMNNFRYGPRLRRGWRSFISIVMVVSESQESERSQTGQEGSVFQGFLEFESTNRRKTAYHGEN